MIIDRLRPVEAQLRAQDEPPTSRLSTEGSPLVKAPDASERIADMAAGELKIAPKQ